MKKYIKKHLKNDVRLFCDNGKTRLDGYFRNKNGVELCWCCKKKQISL